MGLCPRHPGPQHSVLRAPDPWNTGMDERVELAGVQMPPLPLRRVVVAGQLPARLRAAPAAAFGVLDMKLNLRRLDVQPHVSNLPRSGHAKNLLIEIRVEPRPCLPGKAAFSLPKLPRKFPLVQTHRYPPAVGVAVRGKSHPWSFLPRATPKNAKGYRGCQSPRPAAADSNHSLLNGIDKSHVALSTPQNNLFWCPLIKWKTKSTIRQEA